MIMMTSLFYNRNQFNNINLSFHHALYLDSNIMMMMYCQDYVNVQYVDGMVEVVIEVVVVEEEKGKKNVRI